MADVRRIKVGDVVHRDYGDRCVDATVLGFDDPELPLLHFTGGGGVHGPTNKWHFAEDCELQKKVRERDDAELARVKAAKDAVEAARTGTDEKSKKPPKKGAEAAN